MRPIDADRLSRMIAELFVQPNICYWEVASLVIHAPTVDIAAEIEELKADNQHLRKMWAKAVSDLSKATAEKWTCEGCIYSNRKRPQKCSCCRRNKYLKDCYERAE